MRGAENGSTEAGSSTEMVALPSISTEDWTLPVVLSQIAR